MDEIVSLSKRRGFIYQGSEIYGGLAGTWDYGPLGLALKNNLKKLWWKRFVDDRDDIYGIETALLMNKEVWKTTGHVANFADPVVVCKKCNHRFRADNLEDIKKCPDCGGALGEPKQFNMMFKTHVGATEDESSISYLRPETAQGMFVNFKNIMDSFHPKLPFGVAQIGKAFRNEIAPRDFLFRSREFEQMEIEYFIKPTDWENEFESWRKEILAYMAEIGLNQKKIFEHEVAPEDRAFYSKRTIDFEFDFPFGDKKELFAVAYRTDYDLGLHAKASGVDLTYLDEESKERFVPHVIEPTFGLDRAVLAVISDAYTVDELGGEKRVYLKLSSKVAPVLAAVFPLLKNKPELVKKAKEVFSEIKKVHSNIMFDDNGNIGKRYRRQDEIGTPHCITIDFQTLEDDTVTLRDRDSGEQKRIKISDILTNL